MIRKYISGSLLMLVCLDQCVLVGSMAAALWIKTHWVLADPALPVRAHIDLFLRLWPVLAITLFLAGAYDLHTAVGRLRPLLGRTLLSAVALAAVWICGTFYLKMSTLFSYSRGVFTIFLVSSAVGLLGVRLGLARAIVAYRARSGRFKKVLIFGGERLGRRLVRKLERQLFASFKVVGVTDDIAVPGVPRLSEDEALGRIRQGELDLIICDLPPRRVRLMLRIARAAEREGIPIQLTPTIFPGVHLKPRVDQIGPVPVIELRDVNLPLSGVLAKRLLDLTVSAAALVLLAPLFPIIAILIKLDSDGPVFYTQERVGLEGRRFRMIKFRTMRVDAERDTGPTWAPADDPRTTAVGRLLRRSNLDELPQLLNVLVGHMSLVGPRPERPEFVEKFKPVVDRYSHKHWVKPGITGWAQVNGWRGRTSLKRRIQHDIYYVERWSLWFDLKILLLTVLRPHRHMY